MSAFKLILLLAATGLSQAYFLMSVGTIVTESLDPIVAPNAVASHAHKIAGGSNFGPNVTTASLLESECTSVPIQEDKSNYWIPQLYFQWKNGSFSSVQGDFVIYYLYSDKSGVTTPFPENFQMISGTSPLRSYNESSYAQDAVSFLCLNYKTGVNAKTPALPTQQCPDGIRSQINFPSCWDGKNTDSPDHKSHVAFLSEGADKGSCKDPAYPVTIPRIFVEHYWSTGFWNDHASEAMNPQQPFVFSNGDATGYGYHADFINGWEPAVLKRVVDECHCNPYGDATCCAEAGIFTIDQSKTCKITSQVDQIVLGTLDKLPGNNPVTHGPENAPTLPDPNPPALLDGHEVIITPRKRDLSSHKRIVKRFGSFA